MGKFTIKKSENGASFNLKADNGQVIATSQFYKSLNSCQDGIASVKENAPAAAVEDQTVEGYSVETCPKFEIYLDEAKEFRFRLKAANGQIIAASQGYSAMDGCLNGIESVKSNAPEAAIEEEE